MSVNPYQLDYPRNRTAAEEPRTGVSPARPALSMFLDSQSLWVLFEPSASESIANESDILSLTNDTHARSATPSQAAASEDELEDDSSLIDNFTNASTPSQSRLEQLFRKEEPSAPNLDSRINDWRNTSQDELVDDNTALWGLDENLVGSALDRSLLEQLQSTRSSSGRQPAVIPDLYGRILLQRSKMTLADYSRFKRVSGDLRKSLTRREGHSIGYSSNLPDIINQLLVRWFQQQSAPSLPNSHFRVGMLAERCKLYSDILKESTGTMGLDLLSTILEGQMSSENKRDYEGRSTMPQPLSAGGISYSRSLEFSDTATSSSLVLCGGANGSSSLWGDL